VAKDPRWDHLSADRQADFRLHIMLSEVAIESGDPVHALDHLLQALKIHLSAKHFHLTVKLLSQLPPSKRSPFQKELSRIIIRTRSAVKKAIEPAVQPEHTPAPEKKNSNELEGLNEFLDSGEPLDPDFRYSINNQDTVIDKDKLNNLMDSLMDY